MSKQTQVPLDFEGEELEGVFVGRRDAQARPTVMLIPTVMGVSDLELGFAKQLVELGYNGFVADLFGKKFRGSPRDVMFGEMTRLGNDRAALRRRLLAIVEQVRGLKEVEGRKLVVAGYCFGGKCALDVARTGVDIAAAASFHGLLDPPNWPTEKTSTKVCVFHGWDDPMAPPDHVVALAKELTEAGADWQIHGYGHVAHGFTNPNAAKIGIEGVRYNELAAERSWTSFINLLEELFG
ncbi:MAG: carboxymethylenebutenolidase [Sphingomonas sp.]|nr:carboxymethylenebutenolidase [Sphingomonas sp.]